jgi:sodium transport system permease protein
MTPARAVFLKELVDALRDRRALMSLLLYPLVGPVFLAVALWLTTSELTHEGPVELPVVGADHAPGLVGFLRDHGVRIEPPPADVVAAVTSGEADVVLVIPADYAERFADSLPVVVELVSDSSRTSTRAAHLRVQRLVEGYGQRIGSLRLLARGVAPTVARPIVVSEVDASTPERRAAMLLFMVPMFVLIAVFVGGMYVATDCSAGERERRSLEPLLLTPAPRRAIAVGKWLTTVSFSAATALLTLVLSVAALSRVPLDELGLSLSLGAREIASLLLAVLPLSLFAAAAQLFVASFAKSFKEAQTYLSFMMFAPTLPAVFFGIRPIEAQIWMYPVPVLGQEVLLMGIIRGEVVPPAGFVLAALGAVVGAMALLAATARLFQSERIVVR